VVTERQGGESEEVSKRRQEQKDSQLFADHPNTPPLDRPTVACTIQSKIDYIYIYIYIYDSPLESSITATLAPITPPNMAETVSATSAATCAVWAQPRGPVGGAPARGGSGVGGGAGEAGG
jgi:hypothetical protein